MAITLKSREVERLVAEVSAMTGESKTEAIRRALEERSTRLAFQVASENRLERLRRFLADEAWPTIPRRVIGRRVSRSEEEKILGFGPGGV